MRKLLPSEVDMYLAKNFVLCPICGAADALTVKPLPKSGKMVAFCADCVDECCALGLGESEDAAIQDFIERNMP